MSRPSLSGPGGGAAWASQALIKTGRARTFPIWKSSRRVAPLAVFSVTFSSGFSFVGVSMLNLPSPTQSIPTGAPPELLSRARGRPPPKAGRYRSVETYSLRAERQGFKSFDGTPIEVRINQLVQVDAQLELGSATETTN